MVTPVTNAKVQAKDQSIDRPFRVALPIAKSGSSENHCDGVSISDTTAVTSNTRSVLSALEGETAKVVGSNPKATDTKQEEVFAKEVDAISSPPKTEPDTPHLNQKESATIKESVETSLEDIRSGPSILDRVKRSFGTSDRSIDTRKQCFVKSDFIQ